MLSIALLLSGLSAHATSDRSGAPEAVPAVLQDAAPAPEYPQWSGALALGASWTDGNSMTTTLNATLNAVRRAEKDRWTFDAYSNYGSTEELDITTGNEVKDTTANNHGGGVKYDYFATKKLYLIGNGSAKVDHEATLDLRYILGAGVGYQWKESETLKWGTELGLSFVDEDFDDDTSDESFLSLRLASNLAYQISKTSAFEQVVEVLPSLEDSEDLLAKVDNRLKLNITGKWIAQLQYVLDFDDSTPNFVEEADHRVVMGLGWSFGS